MNEVGFYYRPDDVRARLRAERRALGYRVIWSGLIAALGGGIWVGFGDWAALTAAILIAGAVGSLVGYLLVAFIRMSRAKDDSQQMTGTLALGLNRYGVMFAGYWYYWPQVGTLRYSPGRMGASDRLVLQVRDGGENWVPVSFTDASPAALEQAVRVLSNGMVGVDLSRLDV
jgi:hypothetical protein